jgi:hypothetical protein
MKNLLLSLAILLTPMFAMTGFVLGFYLEQPQLSFVSAAVIIALLCLRKYNKRFRLRL